MSPTLLRMRELRTLNPNIFQIIVKRDPVTNSRTIVASFKAIPLKNETIPSIELGHLTRPDDFKNEHVAKFVGETRAWYVGDLISKSHSSSRVVMRELAAYLGKSLRRGVPVYARGLTEVGLQLLRNHGFEPVGDHGLEIGQICRLSSKDGVVLANRLRSTRPRTNWKSIRRIGSFLQEVWEASSQSRRRHPWWPLQGINTVRD
jgi:hypothetical protein